jgi:hypothetical protein
MSFKGIKLVLTSKNNGEESTELNHFGGKSPCDSWSLPSSAFFSEMQLGYDISGVTYLKAVTNSGVVFERGQLKDTDSMTWQTFSETQPLVGFQAYTTRRTIKALGFVKFNCTNGKSEPAAQPGAELVDQKIIEQSSIFVPVQAEVVYPSSLAEESRDLLTEQITWGAGLLLAGIIIGCGSCMVYGWVTAACNRLTRIRFLNKANPLDHDECSFTDDSTVVV